MKIKNTLLFIGLCLAGSALSAQTSETIRALRPGQATIPFTVGKNVFQLHTAVDFGAGANNSEHTHDDFQNRTAAFCYGFTEQFEGLLTMEMRRDRAMKESEETTILTGLSSMNIGTRYNIVDGGATRATWGFLFLLKLPTVSYDYYAQYVEPKFLLTFSDNLSSVLCLTANLGAEYDGLSATPTGLGILSLSGAMSSRWSCFIENYASFQHTFFNYHADGGFAYLANKDLQLDIYGGGGRNSGRTDYFVSMGLSYRVWTQH